MANLNSDESSLRKSSRIPTEFDIEVSMPDHAANLKLSTENVSFGGMFISCASSVLPAVGHFVDFKIIESGLRGAGVVRWTRTRNLNSQASGFGIEFDSAGGLTGCLIARHVRGDHKTGGSANSFVCVAGHQ